LSVALLILRQNASLVKLIAGSVILRTPEPDKQERVPDPKNSAPEPPMSAP